MAAEETREGEDISHSEFFHLQLQT